jgi:glycerol-3-phosphate dehydrogenase subunit C
MKRNLPVEPLRPDNLYDPCIKCTICVTACPVAQVTDAFPGPKQAGPDAQRFRGRGEPVEGKWINLCTGCHRCQVACPADVPIAEINAFAKQRYAAAAGRDLPTHLLTHAFLFMPLGSRFAALANPILQQGWARWLAETFFGVDARAPLPSFARRRFSAMVKDRRQRPSKRRVAYFYGCYTDSNDPEVGLAVLRVLEAAGVEVAIPPQNCCGAALLGAGNLAEAKRLNERNLTSLRAALRDGCEAIVVGSPSCALALSQELSAMLGIECGDVQEKVLDLFTYLERLADAGELNLKFRTDLPPQELVYHEACHLTALGLGANALRTLSRIPNLRVRALDAGCCGLAGTFGLKHKTAPLARKIGEGVARRVAEWRPQAVLSECEGCRLQISALTGVQTKHPAVVLAEALTD